MLSDSQTIMAPIFVSLNLQTTVVYAAADPNASINFMMTMKEKNAKEKPDSFGALISTGACKLLHLVGSQGTITAKKGCNAGFIAFG